MKSHLPLKCQIFIVMVLLALWQLGVSFLIIILLGLAVLLLFRQKKTLLLEDFSGVLAPVSGKIQSVIRKDDFTDIEVVMPWWGDMGVVLPFYSELKNKVKKKGKKFFRYNFFVRGGERRGTVLILENIGTKKKLEIFLGECVGGGGAHIGISPGDRGKAGTSIGYFLFGGLVCLRFFSVGHDLLVKRGERLVAGRTRLWED